MNMPLRMVCAAGFMRDLLGTGGFGWCGFFDPRRKLMDV
jgi:hypothetical protein